MSSTHEALGWTPGPHRRAWQHGSDPSWEMENQKSVVMLSCRAHMQKLEDNLGCQSSPLTMFETGSVWFVLCVSLAGPGIAAVLLSCLPSLQGLHWDYRGLLGCIFNLRITSGHQTCAASRLPSRGPHFISTVQYRDQLHLE